MENKNLKTELKKNEAYTNLLKLSARARSMRQEEERLNLCEFNLPLNHFIKKIYGLENNELGTFNAWKKRGYIVKKGEKGFIFFSSPKTIKVKGEDAHTGEKIETNLKRFCTCYLFSQDQVEELKK